MFMCCSKRSSVINLIYSGQELFSIYICVCMYIYIYTFLAKMYSAPYIHIHIYVCLYIFTTENVHQRVATVIV